MSDSCQGYPVSERFKVLDCYDVYKSNNIWIALLVVDADSRKAIRLYRWEKRRKKKEGQEDDGQEEEVWKVGLCRMNVSQWDWQELSGKIGEVKSKYGTK